MGAVIGHLAAHRLSKSFCLVPAEFFSLVRFERCDDVQTFASGRFAEWD